MTKVEIWGHKVSFDENDRDGFEYLAHKIDREEAEVLFQYAKTKNMAQFESQGGKNYSLIRSADGTFVVAKR